MKSYLTSFIAIAVLSCAGPSRGQEPPAATPPAQASIAGSLPVNADASLAQDLDAVAGLTEAGAEAGERVTAALAEIQEQLAAELPRGLEATADEAVAEVQAAQVLIKDHLTRIGQAVEFAQATPRAPKSSAGTIPGAPPAALAQRKFQMDMKRAHGSTGKTLVIRTSDSNPRTQDNLEEDLAVMSRVFDRTLSHKLDEDRQNRFMGINVLFVPGSKEIRNLYLEGYGALFLLSVDFPLMPPPEKTAQPKEKSETDSTWEDAKRELYGRRDAWNDFNKEFKFNVSNVPEQEYDEKKVDDLKEGLLEALKNATNIRDLKPDDSITVSIFGGANTGQRKGRAMNTGSDDLNEEERNLVIVSQRDDGPAARGTILTVRVKKSDVDAFAKGKLSLEEFRKHASLITYTGDTVGWHYGANFNVP